MLSAVDVRFAASDASFSIKEVDVGLAADMGTLARLPKLGAAANASLLHELALSGRAFGADEAMSALGLVSRVVRGSRVQVVREALEFARVVAAKSPVAVVGTKRFIAHAIDHSCVSPCFFFFPTFSGCAIRDMLTFLYFFLFFFLGGGLCIEWRMHLNIRRLGGRSLSRVR